MSRAILFVNGQLPNVHAAQKILRAEDVLIAVDGGARHVQELGRIPDVLIGDMDSITASLQETLRNAGTLVIVHPAEKDATDLELAIEYAMREGIREIKIVGALGGRMDQTMANISLLGLAASSGIDIRVDDGCEEIQMIGNRAEIQGETGETISLLAWGGPARGVSTINLLYPLHEETLLPNRTRGISNRMTGRTAEINLREGQLICFHIRKE
jgi:thiamine pyrophosphokinase